MRADSWHASSELFPPFAQTREFAALPGALQKIWPLKQKHRRSLGADIADLSRLLTCERGEINPTRYWSRPAYVSAYLYYFLPWNIFRLARLFSALPLPDPNTVTNPLLLDAGSGPLSLPLALWLAKPAWRELPIQVLALDTAKQPLQLGAALFHALSETLEIPSWRVTTAVASLSSLGTVDCGQCQPWFVSAANVLNELQSLTRGSDDLAERYTSLLESWSGLWRKGKPQLLFAEPGTRLGSSAITHMRAAALQLGFSPLAPCTHAAPCPLLKKSGPWCHFVFSAADAPDWLKDISRKAHLFKTSLSLSPLLLSREKSSPSFPTGSLPCRVISQAFPVKGLPSRYACARPGLCLLPDSQRLVSGSLTLAQPAPETANDAKSGAFILRPYIKQAKCR